MNTSVERSIHESVLCERCRRDDSGWGGEHHHTVRSRFHQIPRQRQQKNIYFTLGGRKFRGVPQIPNILKWLNLSSSWTNLESSFCKLWSNKWGLCDYYTFDLLQWNNDDHADVCVEKECAKDTFLARTLTPDCSVTLESTVGCCCFHLLCHSKFEETQLRARKCLLVLSLD